MKRLQILITMLLSFFIFQTYAQEKSSIRILSAADSLPIAGVSMLLGGNNYSSDQQGYVDFSGRGRQIIQFSHLNFIKQNLAITLPVKSYIVYLQPATNTLEEVTVSTGYQNIPKERATGSFVLIDQKTLQQQVSTDILSRLENVTNGLVVDRKSTATPSITIRGIGTILGNREPLIVLDNFPYQGSLDNINPNDVESITILKDAAAASIWGARAGNGVIVITTKKASANQALRIDLNTNISTADKPDLYSLSKISSAGMIEVEQMLYDKGFYNSSITSVNKPALTPVVEILLAKTNGTVTAATATAQLAALARHDVRDDYLKYQYQNPVNRQIALNLTAGSKNISWGFATSYDANTTNLEGTFNRLSLTLKNSATIGKRLTLNSSVRYTGSKSTGDKLAYGDLTPNGVEQSPYTFLADENGNPLPVVNTYRLSYLATAGNGRLLDWSYYPLLDDQYNHRSIKVQDILANLSARYNIGKGLNASLQYQYGRQNSNTRNLYEAESFLARNQVNVYTQISNTGTVTYKVPKGGILDLYSAVLETQNLRGQFSYDRSFGRHSVNAIAGAEIQQANNEGNGNRSYGYDDQTLSFSPVDYTGLYPSFVSGSSSMISSGALTGFNSTMNRFVSLFSNASYTFDQRYVVSASARKDASNLFGLRSNEKWKPLWSAGLGWNISNEHFFESKWLNTLRLRATYGFSGNVDPARTAVTTITLLSASPYTQSPTARFNQYANPELRWEKIATTNLGLDFAMLNNRINGSLEVYRKHATDLYGTTPVDYTSINVGRIITNAAEISGKGLDFSLRTINIQGPFKWNSEINFNIYRDKVLNYYISNQQASNFTTGGQTITGLVGKPVYSILSYPWAGLDPQTGEPQGIYKGNVSKDYLAITGTDYTIDDLVYHGPAMPTVYGTIGNSFAYKGLSLQVRLSYKLGYYFRRSGINYTSLFNNGIGHSDYDNRWQKPGDEQFTEIPSMVYPAVLRRDNFYSSSAVLVEKGDHIRLAFVTLSYELQPALLKHLPIKRFALYANASNLGILWRANKLGLDPDYRTGNISNPRTYSIGLNTSF